MTYEGSAIYDIAMTAPSRRSTTVDGSAGGEPLSCGNQSTYNRVANAGNLHRLSSFQMPFGILHNLSGEFSLTFPLEKCHFITDIYFGCQIPDIYRKMLMHIADGKGIAKYQMRVKDYSSKYELDFEPV